MKLWVEYNMPSKKCDISSNYGHHDQKRNIQNRDHCLGKLPYTAFGDIVR